jgi:hypothetical protein
MEPDMRRRPLSGDISFKKYKVYRSTASNMNSIPPDAMQFPEQHYQHIATVDIDTTAIPEYTDTVFSICNPIVAQWNKYPVRYRVQAIDSFGTASVLSDFAKALGGVSQSGGLGDNLTTEENENIPKRFALRQNYPNPFNPITNIQYDLPRNRFVTIKIYDILGKEVMTVVNEFKEAGRYIISFNASDLASGIYYYKIKAGTFEDIKKMIVIK